MISGETVFIVGAGAHCSYGFPSGRKLKSDIISFVDESINGYPDINLLHLPSRGVGTANDVQPENMRRFVRALTDAGQPSIDAFINANLHMPGFETIGKASIAKVLLDYEESATPSSNEDWLEYLFEVLIEGVGSPQQFVTENNVSFITFNYDTYLERWLLSRIKSSFGLEIGQALEVLTSIPILHVYGDLGTFQRSTTDKLKSWVIATKKIRIIYDAEINDRNVNACKSLLEAAKSVCLLGFGYHQENIDILNLGHYVSQGIFNIFGTRYDITDAEFDRCLRRLGSGISNSSSSHKCRDALRNLSIF